MHTRVRGNLPAEVNSFIGRRREVSEARRLLSTARLVTLIGPGGVGKTRLARQVAAMTRGYGDGVWFVEFGGLPDGELVASAVAVALGVTDPRDEPIARLCEYLGNKELLLVLDNCEHVVDACAQLATKLLAAVPGVRILAASRHVLGVEGEHLLPVPPLSLPHSDGAGADSEAVALFCERVAALVPNFSVSPGNQETVNEICRRLEGIPLAIELAASRCRVLGLDQMLEELEQTFDFLTTCNRSAPSRQQTLENAVTWSYDLCSPAEQLLWTRLSVFLGSFGLDAVSDVCSDVIAVDDVFGLLTGLLDKSIIFREDGSFGHAVRFRMLDVIRRFGRAQLATSGAEAAILARHLDYYRRMVAHGENRYFTPREVEWLTDLRTEHDNLRAALEFGISDPRYAQVALDMAARLQFFWIACGLIREGHRWLCRALAAADEATVARARGLMVCGYLGLYLGHRGGPVAMLAESRSLAERFEDLRTVADVEWCAALAAFAARDLGETRRLIDSAAAHFRAVDDRAGLHRALFLSAVEAYAAGRDEGHTIAEESLALAEAAGAGWSRGYGLFGVGLFRLRAGDVSQAVADFRQAVTTVRQTGDQKAIAQFLVALGWCAAALDQHGRAARLLGVAEALFERSGATLSHAMVRDTVADRYQQVCRERLGEAEFATQFAEGRALELDEAIDFALAERPKPVGATTAHSLSQVLAPLTHREAEVAELVSEGLTNREIAARLVVSPRTVESHVDHILGKLGFRVRAKIATWVVARKDRASATHSPEINTASRR